MTRVVVYCRVSSEMQTEDTVPIQGQIEECTRLAEARGWEVVHVYKDEAYTGRNTDRPAFQQMLSDAHRKPVPFDRIIVWKGNRIARNVEDRLGFESIIARKGIELVSVTEPDFAGSTRVLMLPIMAAVDAYQSYLIGEDTLRGMKVLARQGFSAGGRPPKGYRIKRELSGLLKRNGEPIYRSKWEPDPEWKDKALRAFQMLSEGRSTRGIISETGIIQHQSAVSTYFRNRTFIGERVFNAQRTIGKRKGVKMPANNPDTYIRVECTYNGVECKFAEKHRETSILLTGDAVPLDNEWGSRLTPDE